MTGCSQGVLSDKAPPSRRATAHHGQHHAASGTLRHGDGSWTALASALGKLRPTMFITTRLVTSVSGSYTLRPWPPTCASSSSLLLHSLVCISSSVSFVPATLRFVFLCLFRFLVVQPVSWSSYMLRFASPSTLRCWPSRIPVSFFYRFVLLHLRSIYIASEGTNKLSSLWCTCQD